MLGLVDGLLRNLSSFGRGLRVDSSNDSPVWRSRMGFCILMTLVLVVGVFRLSTGFFWGEGYMTPSISKGEGLALSVPQPLTVAVGQKEFHGSSSCNVSYVNGRGYGAEDFVVEGSIIGLGGWIADSVNHKVPRQAWIVISATESNDAYQVPISFWMRRPDVQEALGGARSYQRTGFAASINLAGLRSGRYHLYVIYSGFGVFYTCDEGRYLVVRGSTSPAGK